MLAALLILILIVVTAQLFLANVPTSAVTRAATAIVVTILVVLWLLVHFGAVWGALR